MTQAGENRVDVVECVVFVQPERPDFVFKSEQFGNLPGRLFFDEYAVFAVSLFEPAGDVASLMPNMSRFQPMTLPSAMRSSSGCQA